MIRSIRLTDEDRDHIRFVLASLNLTQKVFGERAGVPQGWLSGVMSGKRPAVEPEMLERMGTAAQGFLEDAIQEGRVVQAEIEALTKGMGQAFRIRQDGPKLLAPLGGAIPWDAVNFIERPQEMARALALLGGTSFTMSVEGGPKTGKTTFLRWFEEEAEKRGFEVAYLDCGDFAPITDVKDEDLEARFNDILMHIAEYLIEAWSLPSVNTDKMRFMNWWLRMKGPLAAGRPRPRLLILDRVTRLGLKLGEYMLKLIRTIHNARGSDGVAISFALGVDADIASIKNDLTRSDAYSVVQPRIVMRRFDDGQVREMLQTVCGESFGEKKWIDLVQHLARDYHCQPYFVHAAANFLQTQADPDALQEEVKELRGDFETVREMERYIKAYRPKNAPEEVEKAYDRLLAA